MGAVSSNYLIYRRGHAEGRQQSWEIRQGRSGLRTLGQRRENGEKERKKEMKWQLSDSLHCVTLRQLGVWCDSKIEEKERKCCVLSLHPDFLPSDWIYPERSQQLLVAAGDFQYQYVKSSSSRGQTKINPRDVTLSSLVLSNLYICFWMFSVI